MYNTLLLVVPRIRAPSNINSWIRARKHQRPDRCIDTRHPPLEFLIILIVVLIKMMNMFTR